MLFNYLTRFVMNKDGEPSGSSPQKEDKGDAEIDDIIDSILDGEKKDKTENEEAPKKDPAFTKQFAKRLSEEREKLAKQLGYDSYETLMKGHTRKTITEAGYDPDDPDFKKAIEAAVKERLETDPEIAEQRKLLEQYKAQETKNWERQQLEALEKEYGVKLKSLSDVDAKTKELMAKGLDLTDAYFIANKSKIKPKQQTTNDKEHLKPESTNVSKDAGDGKIIVTQADIDYYRNFSGSSETDEQIRARIEKIRGAKK